MMGKTHIFVGTACALLFAPNQDISSVATIIVGGVIGSIICDIDVKATKFQSGPFDSRFLAITICVVMIFLDFIIKGDLVKAIANQSLMRTLIGVGAFLVLSIIGYHSKHRQFTHSLLSLLLFTGAILLINEGMVPAFMLGYASHIMMDLLNKKPIRLLFPIKKGWCLNWCYADKLGNKIFLVVGIGAALWGLVSRLI